MPTSMLEGIDLADALRDARAHTLALVEDLSDAQLAVPYLSNVNPFLWELGHLAWFQEKWVLRHLRGEPPLWPQADALYDSANVAHATRWRLPLPGRAGTLEYMQAVLERVLLRLDAPRPGTGAFYFPCLALLHEDMHGEAFAYMRQTLAYPAPPLRGSSPPPGEAAAGGGDASIPGGSYRLGALSETPFIFDNEKWAHPIAVAPFRMARRAVTNAEFSVFVDSGGYRQASCWSDAGWAWRQGAGADHPLYWRRGERATWFQRRFDRWLPLVGDEPVVYVNWYEADAYCRWAGRRLPTEAEWELAAATEPGHPARKRLFPWGDTSPTAERANLDLRASHALPVALLPEGDSAFGVRQMLGNVWEWTASAFGPFPGFAADPYKEYSQPWFGTHKVLRGGSFATRSRLARNQYRNFFLPERRDIPASFRTCALEAD